MQTIAKFGSSVFGRQCTASPGLLQIGQAPSAPDYSPGNSLVNGRLVRRVRTCVVGQRQRFAQAGRAVHQARELVVVER